MLLFNRVAFGLAIIAASSKDCWQIETLLKGLERHLKAKNFVETGVSAVNIQVSTALIALLPLRYLQVRSTLA